ncbi:hypothetical protein BRETT_002044 [Brettanomyces bruxellensis]|uniref:Protein DML1 n=1 Tax=Dekkera bruxellensis TaxID=5007 RepID=A0A871RIV3_DEKBR|nr:uncharacterized protein BRETT_002044 [Brettanomyces bruxellensis]QOU21880.1 hypothetical protein BRETT_002044 [Brettanomyces bruxellensis]
MHEIITLSFSQRSNCIATHLYNVAESRLQNVNDEFVDNSVLLESKPGQFGSTINYYPRALLWDYNNGFGSLNPSEYFESKPDVEALKKLYPNVVTTGPSTLKNQYQKALDQGTKTEGLANLSDMRCWSDYSRVIYRPESLLKLNRWDYSFDHCKGHLRSHPEIEFGTYDVGVDEFSDEENVTGAEAVEENFRKVLEECDTLTGLNVITEGDTAWGGFSSEFLSMIRDEYISGTPIVTWSLTRNAGWQSLPVFDRMSRIKTLRSLSSVSSLYIPLNTEPSIAQQCAKKHSTWAISSYQSVILDSLMTLLSQRKNRWSMGDFVNGLTRGNEKRKIVTSSSINDHNMSPERMFEGKKSTNAHGSHVFARSVINRPLPGKQTGLNENELKEVCGFEDLINNGADSLNLKAYNIVEPFDNRLDSFPEEFRKQEFSWCSFNITNKPQRYFGEMADYISHYCKNDEREELKDDLSSMEEQYYWADESSDTDYE